MQRERDFHCYEDLEARYELRSSLWVQPQNNWGAGTIELVEIPSPSEVNDNIVSYWVPKEKITEGKELHWTCKLSALLHGPDEGTLAKVTSTRINPPHEKTLPRFVIDFSGDSLPPMTGSETLEANAQTSKGKIQNLVSLKNEVTGGWRVFFDLADAGHEPADLKIFLQHAGKQLSELWVYHYQAE